MADVYCLSVNSVNPYTFSVQWDSKNTKNFTFVDGILSWGVSDGNSCSAELGFQLVDTRTHTISGLVWPEGKHCNFKGLQIFVHSTA